MAREFFQSGRQPVSQPQQRRDLNPKDQFGRTWLLTIEKASMDACGEVVPCGFRDPLRTPMGYIRLASSGSGPDTSRCVVLFDPWLTQQREAEERWYTELRMNATHIYRGLKPSDVADLEQDQVLLDATGPKPWPSVAVLEAAQAGDRQYLGLEPLDRAHREALGVLTRDDLKAEATSADSLAPTAYKAFVAWAVRTGRASGLADAARLWRERKEQAQLQEA